MNGMAAVPTIDGASAILLARSCTGPHSAERLIGVGAPNTWNS